jgi:predicted nucleic acid-binding protein
MIFVDSSCLVALVMPRDQLRQRAINWSEALDGPFLTTEYVLCEVVNISSVIVHRRNVHYLLDGIFAQHESWEVVAASPVLFREGLSLHRQTPDKQWSLTDCISFGVMRGRGVRKSLTYDHHFEQAGFEALLRKDAP